MRRFRLKFSFDVNRQELIDILDGKVGPPLEDLHLSGYEDDSEPSTVHELSPERRIKRVSKVNEAILKVLAKGPQRPPELKAALEEVNLSPGSLSTGLAFLKREGQITSDGEGLWSLTMDKAAE